MEAITNNNRLTFKSGAFRDSIRAHRKYKQQWQTMMDEKLDIMEKEILRAKADTFFQMEAS